MEWLPLVKWFLAIPHYIVLIPRDDRLRDHRVVRDSFHRPLSEGSLGLRRGFMRWANRVSAYAFVLVTDQYPPFRLSP
ncbi:MAG TPA: hypothetical protein VIM33_16340 [Gaiellaceae bacterium]|jgi:hypothetical protein